VEDRTSQRYE
jgi:hypothetical protein